MKKLALILNDTRYLSDDCLFIQNSLYKSVDRKLIGYDHFLLFNKLKLLEMRILRKFASICKKPSIESDQYHVPVQRSRTMSGL